MTKDDDAILDKQEKLLKALKELPKQQRICMELFYPENRSYMAISEITGYPINKVKSYLQNDKKRLKSILGIKNNRFVSKGLNSHKNRLSFHQIDLFMNKCKKISS